MIKSSSFQRPHDALQRAAHTTNTVMPAVDFHESTLGSLPIELLLQVISNIPSARDVASIGLTCRGLSQIYQDDAIWKPLVLKCFPSRASEITDNGSFPLYQKLTRIGYNVAHGICDQKALQGHMNGVLRYADGMLLTGSKDGTVRIWDAKTGECQHVLQGHTDLVRCLQYADGMLLTGSKDGTVRIWDTKTGECQHVLQGHTDSVTYLQYADGMLFTASLDGKVRIWDAKTGECQHVLQGHMNGVLRYADGMLLTGSKDGTVRIWDAKTGECQHVLQGHTDSVTCLQYADGMLLTGSFDSTIRIWDAKTGECQHVLQGHTDLVRCLQYADGMLFTASLDGKVRIWDAKTGECKHVFQGTTGWIRCLRYADGMLFTASCDGTVQIWDAKTGEYKHVLQGHMNGVLRYADGMLFTVSKDGTVRIWDAKTGECKHVLQGHTDSVTCLQYADGMLLTGSKDGTARIWNFNATTDEIFKNIADQLFSDVNEAKARLARMPEQERNKVYWELYKILNPSSHSDHRYGERAFYDTHGLSCTPQEKARAIHHYIAREIAKLFEGDESQQQLALRKFNQLLPEEIRNKIYYEMYLILQPFPHASLTSGEDAFQGNPQAGKVATGKNRAEAIQNYLAKRPQ